ncbi:MAG: type II toxin-antitoxin system VapC family toxin [Myxococcota bacterium]|jgi:hypothetical protein
MIKEVLLDSDVIIEFLRGNPKIRDLLRGLVSGGDRLVVTPISIAEIHAGMRRGEEKEIDAFFSGMELREIDDPIARKAGEYLRTYSKSHGLELGDALVAASASTHGSALWTLNIKHYPMADLELLKL